VIAPSAHDAQNVGGRNAKKFKICTTIVSKRQHPRKHPYLLMIPVRNSPSADPILIFIKISHTINRAQLITLDYKKPRAIDYQNPCLPPVEAMFLESVLIGLGEFRTLSYKIL
jgi:hypothetical protein